MIDVECITPIVKLNLKLQCWTQVSMNIVVHTVYICISVANTAYTISVANTAVPGADANNDNKKVVFKNCAEFTDCMSEINNT